VRSNTAVGKDGKRDPLGSFILANSHEKSASENDTLLGSLNSIKLMGQNYQEIMQSIVKMGKDFT